MLHRDYPVIIHIVTVARITKRSVEAVLVPVASARSYLWDDQLKGFGLMVTPKGARSYVVQFRIGGRGAPTRRYTIGKHGSPWTAEKARERAVEILELIRKKIDPIEADRERLRRATDSSEEAVRLAFSDYADGFIKRHAEARKLRSTEDIRAVFRRDLKPYFGDRSIKSIKRSDVQACLDEVHERSGSAANKAHKWLRKMLGYAVNRGDLETSPMEGMSPPHQEGHRDRVLRGQELALVWRAAADIGEPWASFVHLLVLLGQRLREVAGMAWEELDLENEVWVIPGSRTKNKRDHLVPLPAPALQIIERMRLEVARVDGPVFTTNGVTPISGFSKLKHSLDQKIQDYVEALARESALKPKALDAWVFHDLRRTVGTGCQALGVPIEHTEAVLNHVSGKRGGLAAIYQLHNYHQEKAAALNAWSRHVGEVACRWKVCGG